MHVNDPPGSSGELPRPADQDEIDTRPLPGTGEGDPSEQTSSTLDERPPARRGRPSSSIPTLPRGAEVGRFTVLSPIGAGAMGAVYEAYDPQLDRRIALKLLAVGGGDQDATEAARSRMMREAKALAKLSHPNVVSIFDVGTWNGDVFLALELVRGATLREWLREARPSRREILEAYRAAGRGLAAAHAAGLVHRDFKPANVIRADDGRIRVLDFGLARAADAVAGESGETEDADSGADSALSGRLDLCLTVAGAVIGTPAYMSPEQHRGEQALASSDQFSFCVALYEALYGERPFAGRTRAALRRNACGGRVEPAPDGTDVPRWIRQVLVRGLAVDPVLRYPDMDALLAALGRDPAARRRRVAWVALGVVAVGAALAIGRASTGESESAVCSRGGEHVEGLWSPDAAADLRRAFAATGHYLAQANAERLGELVQRYRADWVSSYAGICEATRLRGEQSGELLDLRMACLMRRRDELRDLIELARDRPSTEVVENAVKAALMLEPPAQCETARQADVRAPAPAQAAEVESLRRALGQARTLEHAGRYDSGVAIAERVVAQAAELGYAPLWAEALHAAASLQERAGHLDAARQSLELALEQASLAGDARRVAAVQADWMFVVGHRQGDHARVLAQAPLAEAAARVIDDERAVGMVARALGAIALGRADHLEGEAQFARYLAMARRVYGERHVVTAGALNNLGTALLSGGAWERALPLFEEAVAITVEALGPLHPSVAPLHKNVAACHELAGEYAEAEALLREALALEERALGAEHADLGLTAYMLGKVLRNAGRDADAEPLLQRAIAIHERSLGPAHAYLIGPLDDLAVIAKNAGELSRARAYAERAHGVALEALGSEHPYTAYTLATLGSIAGRGGDAAEARRRYAQALAIYERAAAPDAVEIADVLSAIVEYSPRGAERRRRAERALALYEAKRIMSRGSAAVRFHLAQELVADSDQRDRALALAQRARAFFGGLPASPENAASVATIDAWLAEHGAR